MPELTPARHLALQGGRDDAGAANDAHLEGVEGVQGRYVLLGLDLSLGASSLAAHLKKVSRDSFRAIMNTSK